MCRRSRRSGHRLLGGYLGVGEAQSRVDWVDFLVRYGFTRFVFVVFLLFCMVLFRLGVGFCSVGLGLWVCWLIGWMFFRVVDWF